MLVGGGGSSLFIVLDKWTVVVLWIERKESKNVQRKWSSTGWISRVNWHEELSFGQTTTDEMLVLIPDLGFLPLDDYHLLAVTVTLL